MKQNYDFIDFTKTCNLKHFYMCNICSKFELWLKNGSHYFSIQQLMDFIKHVWLLTDSKIDILLSKFMFNILLSLESVMSINQHAFCR